MKTFLVNVNEEKKIVKTLGISEEECRELFTKVWSPICIGSGYNQIVETDIGDTIIQYSGKKIISVGIVTSLAVADDRPLKSNKRHNGDGYSIRVAHQHYFHRGARLTDYDLFALDLAPNEFTYTEGIPFCLRISTTGNFHASLTRGGYMWDIDQNVSNTILLSAGIPI